jgi:hypothetical protein
MPAGRSCLLFFFEELAGALLHHIRRRASQSFTVLLHKNQKTQALKTLEGNISIRELGEKPSPPRKSSASMEKDSGGWQGSSTEEYDCSSPCGHGGGDWERNSGGKKSSMGLSAVFFILAVIRVDEKRPYSGCI